MPYLFKVYGRSAIVFLPVAAYTLYGWASSQYGSPLAILQLGFANILSVFLSSKVVVFHTPPGELCHDFTHYIFREYGLFS